MSSLEKTAAQVADALAKAADAGAPLQQARQALDEALAELRQALAGATGPEADAVVGGFQEALGSVRALAGIVTSATALLRTYASTTLGVTSEAASATRSARLGAQAAREEPSADTIERLRAELPPPVTPRGPAPGRPQQKTHGRWVDASGRTHEIVSGRDDAYRRALDYLDEIGARRVPQRVSDVEMKLAVHMRKHGITNVTLVINNRPCAGPMGCDELLPVLLPEGSTMTVHGANGFKKTYRGGGTSKWLP